MLTTVRQVGNSRGVLIPAAFLVSCRIEDQVDMQLQDGQIIIRPVKPALRQAWFEPQQAVAPAELTLQQKEEDHAWDNLPVADDSEWVW